MTINTFLFTYESLKDVLKIQNSMYNSFSLSKILTSLKSLIRSFLRLPTFMLASFVNRSLYFSTLQSQSTLLIVPLSIMSATAAHLASFPLFRLRNVIDLEHSKLLAYRQISIREGMKLVRADKDGFMGGAWSTLNKVRVGQASMVLALY